MCGPATVPITFAWHAGAPAPPPAHVAVRSCPAVSGRGLIGRRAGQQGRAASGSFQTRVRVIGDRSLAACPSASGPAGCPLRQQKRPQSPLLARPPPPHPHPQAPRPGRASAPRARAGSAAPPPPHLIQSHDGASTWVARTISSSGAGSGSCICSRGASSCKARLETRGRGASRSSARRCADRPHHPRGVHQAAAGRPDHARDRRSRQQDHTGDQQEDARMSTPTL